MTFLYNRRAALMAAVGVGALFGQTRDHEVEVNAGTFIRVWSGDKPEWTSVAIRSDVQADKALVTVFFKVGDLLLSNESIAPVVGSEAWGMTRRDFPVPVDRVEFIRVEFLKTVSTVDRIAIGKGR